MIEDDIKTIEPYIHGFAAGTIAVKEAFRRLCSAARVGEHLDPLYRRCGDCDNMMVPEPTEYDGDFTDRIVCIVHDCPNNPNYDEQQQFCQNCAGCIDPQPSPSGPCAGCSTDHDFED